MITRLKSMQLFLAVGVILAVLSAITCPPVKQQPAQPKKQAEEQGGIEDDPTSNVEYSRYLKEVVSALEEDQEFVKRLEAANSTDIKTGNIAQHLDFVDHNIRTKLDEIKRREIQRLNEAHKALVKRKNGMDPQMKKMVAHLDHGNPHSFEVDDLEKLIKRASHDLEEVDKKRKDDFKRYEMEKEHNKREKLKKMDEPHRKEEEHKIEEMEKKHKDHPKLHEPGSKDQLEEVWEEEDGLNKEDFDPKTFFKLHDKNEDGVLDEFEIEGMFQHELNKMYDPKAPEDDNVEREEEMNRMREHVFDEIDKDKDRQISMEEFMASTKTDAFKKDEGWKGLDEQKIYTDEELAAFEKEYEELMRQHGQPDETGQVHQETLHYIAKERADRIQQGIDHHASKVEHHDQKAEHHETEAEKHKVDGNHEQASHHEQKAEEHRGKAEHHSEKVELRKDMLDNRARNKLHPMNKLNNITNNHLFNINSHLLNNNINNLQCNNNINNLQYNSINNLQHIINSKFSQNIFKRYDRRF